MFISIPKESVTVQKPEKTTYTENGFLAFDIVHAVEFSRIGRTKNLTSRIDLRATAQTYHQKYFYQPDATLAEALVRPVEK